MSETMSFELKRPEVIAEKFDDEYVIVNLDGGSYYGLAGSGALIWEMVLSGATQAEMVASLAEQFDADPAELDRAVAGLVHELEQESIIVPSSNSSLSPPADRAPVPRPATRLPFVAPILEKHMDMQQVLQLDPIHEVDESGWPAQKAEQ